MHWRTRSSPPRRDIRPAAPPLSASPPTRSRPSSRFAARRCGARMRRATELARRRRGSRSVAALATILFAMRRADPPRESWSQGGVHGGRVSRGVLPQPHARGAHPVHVRRLRPLGPQQQVAPGVLLVLGGIRRSEREPRAGGGARGSGGERHRRRAGVRAVRLLATLAVPVSTHGRLPRRGGAADHPRRRRRRVRVGDGEGARKRKR